MATRSKSFQLGFGRKKISRVGELRYVSAIVWAMRILLTADPALPVPPEFYGGIERIIATLAEALLSRGHEIGLLAHPQSTRVVTANYKWPSPQDGAWPHIRSLHRAVNDFKPGLVHSFSRLLYLSPALVRRGLPKIMSYQRHPSRRTVRWANALAGNSIMFTGCSESITAKGQNGGGKWRTIHNFVDVERYTFVPAVPDDAALVFLSRIESIKGTHIAIEACRCAGRKLIIAGNHSEKDDPEGRYWRELIKPQIDGRNVEYVGPVNDEEKNNLLGRAAAMIVPVQWDEPFGIVFIEALACGTPVISCARGALPEIVRNGIEGFLIRDSNEAAHAISRLDKIVRSKCSERARTSFSASSVVARYEELYRSFIKQ
jgi:glycosyltransferase involved in cell wall biosynthesis